MKLSFLDESGLPYPAPQNVLLNEFATKIVTKNKNFRVKNVISNSSKFGLISQMEYFDKQIANDNNIDSYYVIKKGDFVYNPRISSDAPYGPINIYKLPEEGIVSPLYLCFSVSGINLDYLGHFFKSNSWYRHLYLNGDSGARHDRVNIKDTAFLAVPLILPSLPEQQKIAEFFSALDERIELTADKVKLLKEQKQGYLQKIFNRELVFTDENGDRYPEWEQKKLSEVAEIIGGGTPSTGEPSYWDGDINWFSPTDVGKSKYLNESTRKITEAGLKNSSAKIHPVGTVLLTTRASLGRMGILRSEAATNQGFQSLLPRDNTTSEFLYYLQPQIETYCDVKASGSTFKEISGKEIAKMPVKLPSLPEQEKIAEFFSALDEQIELTENKLTLLKEQKKGYLQGIFE